MSITTKTGDKGYSSVAGKRFKKDNKIFEAIGTIDELQSVVEDEYIARDLYEIMGEVGWNKKFEAIAFRINFLESEIEKIEKELKPVTNFLIFKKEKAREFNWIRTVCRRAERKVVALRNYKLRITNYELIVIYLNRLSDYFYLLSRVEEEK